MLLFIYKFSEKRSFYLKGEKDAYGRKEILEQTYGYKQSTIKALNVFENKFGTGFLSSAS